MILVGISCFLSETEADKKFQIGPQVPECKEQVNKLIPIKLIILRFLNIYI